MELIKRILIIDDTGEVCGMFREALAGESGIELICSSSDLDELAAKIRYDIFIIDFHSDGLKTDLTRLVGFVKSHLDRVQPLMLAVTSDPLSVLKLGIKGLGVMPKPIVPKYLLAQTVNTLSILASNRSINDVTHLPGNYVINYALRRKIDSGEKFVLIYLDIDKFKPYTDYYGIRRASALIAYLGDVLAKAVVKHGKPGDFVGHVGGDDYVLILNDYGYAQKIGDEVIRLFDENIKDFYSAEDYERGYIEIVNRKGIVERFKPISVSLAMVSNEHHKFSTTAEVYERMGKVKDDAKQISGSVMLCDTADA